jgi:hypothetical protein
VLGRAVTLGLLLGALHATEARAAAPAGLPDHVPAAATAPQPSLPEPAKTVWPFSNAFPHTSGTGRLVRGASLWSDFLFDDHGPALTDGVPLSPLQASSILAWWQGSYGYPSGAAKNDGADIFRTGVALDKSASYWRVDWATLADPKVPIAEWTFDTDADASTGASRWPAAAGLTSPGIEKALVVSSRGAWLIDTATGSSEALR